MTVKLNIQIKFCICWVFIPSFFFFFLKNREPYILRYIIKMQYCITVTRLRTVYSSSNFCCVALRVAKSLEWTPVDVVCRGSGNWEEFQAALHQVLPPHYFDCFRRRLAIAGHFTGWRKWVGGRGLH